MEKIPCPGCRTELDFEVTTCPICLRPRSKYEITRAYSSLRADQTRRRRQPFIVAGWLALAGAIAFAGFRFKAPLSAAAAAARARFKKFSEEATDPRRLSTHASDAPPAPAPADTGPAQSAPPPPAGQAVAAEAPAAPSAPQGAVKGRGAVMPQRVRPTGDALMPPYDPNFQWGLKGRVYNLLTLKPAPMTSLVVRNANGGMAAAINTDEDGRYAVVLTRLAQGGYEIAASGGGWYPAAFYESDIPYAQLSASERQEMADNAAASGESHPTPLSDITGEPFLRRDIFLVPQR